MPGYHALLTRVRREIQVEGYRRVDPRTGREIEVSPYTRQGQPAQERPAAVPGAGRTISEEVRPAGAYPGTAVVMPPPADLRDASPRDLIERGQQPHLYDFDGDGVADAARVGVPAREVGAADVPMVVPRDPELASLANEIAQRYRMTRAQAVAYYLEVARKNGNVFSTDDAKMLIVEYASSKENRSTTNIVVHQIANALAKQSFLQHLDSLKNDPNAPKKILVTAGGVAGGKTTALKYGLSDHFLQQFGAVWDAAGEQYAAEMPWVLDEARKRGLDVTFVFVDADPIRAFDGMLERAKNTGRTVDALLFMESYVVGANNFKAFYERNKKEKGVDFVFISNRGEQPQRLTDFPEAAIKENGSRILRHAYRRLIEKARAKQLPPYVFWGATMNRRTWIGEDRRYLAHAPAPKQPTPQGVAQHAVPPRPPYAA